MTTMRVSTKRAGSPAWLAIGKMSIGTLSTTTKPDTTPLLPASQWRVGRRTHIAMVMTRADTSARHGKRTHAALATRPRASQLTIARLSRGAQYGPWSVPFRRNYARAVDRGFQTSDTDGPEDEGGYDHEESYPLPSNPSNLPYTIETIDVFDLKTS